MTVVSHFDNSTEELPLFRVKVLSLSHVTLLTTFSTYFVDRGHLQLGQELNSVAL